ncbi:MAG: DUF4131 domain-containing protein [Phycisphaerae bacterium]|nr:DUF4131 domain-containing protein [Phycisphaerae bacterium]
MTISEGSQDITPPIRRPQPLVAAAVIFVAGICLGMVAPWSARISLAVAATVWLACVGAMLVHRRGINALRNVLLAVAIGAGGVGVWQVNQQQVSSRNIALYLPPHGQSLITARMLIISAPKFSQPVGRRALYSATGPSTTFIARLLAAHAHGRWHRVTGNVIVRIPGFLPGLRNNQQVQITAWISHPPGAVNPGTFDYRHYLSTYRILASISARHSRELHILSARQSLLPLSGWLDWLRLRLRRRLLWAQRGHTRAAFSNIALLLGYRDPSIRRVARHFSQSGAAHLLALSGLHVVIIAGAIWLLLRFFIRRPRYRALVAMLVIVVYMLATPCGPPVVRATVAIVMVFITMLLGWPVEILNIVAAAAIVVLFRTPAAITGVPFELTFAVTVGLVVLGTRFQRAVFGQWLQRQGDLARAANTRWSYARLHIKHWICAVITANAIGTIMAVPLTIYRFNQITPLAIISGLILLPLVSLALVAGLLELLAVLVWPPLAAAVATAFYPVVFSMIYTVRQLAAIPGSVINVRSGPWWNVVLCYAAIALWMMRRRLGLSRATVMILGVGATALLAGWYAITQPHRSVDIWVTSAGSGNAAIITGPDGSAAAINCGSLGSPHFLAGQMASLLHHRGIEQLNACIAGRIDPAHASAIGMLASRCGHAPVFTDYCDAHFAATTASHRRFFASLADLKLQVHGLSSGNILRIGSSISCRVLWPPRNLPAQAPTGMRGCILLLAACHRPQVLFLDRTENPAVVQMLAAHGIRAATVVLTGPGRLHAPMLAALRRLDPTSLILSGEVATAFHADQRLLRPVPSRIYAVRQVGCVKITLSRQGSTIQTFLASPALSR